jgi:hypothetical protein
MPEAGAQSEPDELEAAVDEVITEHGDARRGAGSDRRERLS